MSILKILTIPDPKLKHKSIRVNNFNNDLKNEINDMYDTLYASGNGIGLAAPQVGILKRIVVIDLKENETSNPLTLVNPEIIKRSEQKFINEEGCLSVPEYYAEVENAFDFVALRIGWVINPEDAPNSDYFNCMYLSSKDCIQCFKDAINSKEQFSIKYGVSGNAIYKKE